MKSSRTIIRQVDPASERPAVLRLLEGNLPEAAAGGRFDWAYLDNPGGKATVWLAETADGVPVGTSAAFPRQFWVNGKAVRALVLSDFAIDSQFRTLGPAVALLRATLAPVDQGSFEFALDHPSKSMLAVYKRLGGAELGRHLRNVRLVKLGGLTKRRWGAGVSSSVVGALGDFVLRARDKFWRVPAGLSVEVHAGIFGDEFAELGRRLEKRHAVFGDRNPDYLNWRYRSGIRFSYTTVTVRSENVLLACAILQETDSTLMTIVEFLSPADAAVERALFRGVLDVAHESDAESLQASCADGGAWSATLARLGFSARERSTGPVVYSPKHARWTNILTDCDQWWMTDGDRDG